MLLFGVFMKRVLILLILSVFTCFLACANNGMQSTGDSEKIENNTQSAKEMLFEVIEKTENAESFYTVSEGETKSFGITQTISAKRVVIGENVFKQSVSCSALVKTAEQTYVKDGKYLLRKGEEVKSVSKVTWKNCVTEIDKEEYLERYGAVITGLNNYVLNEQTVLSVEKEDTEKGYLLKVTADSVGSTVNIVKEMKTNANSTEFPTFESVYMELSVDKNLQVISVTYKGKYKVKIAVLGEVDCEENMTETFYGIDQTTSFDEEEFFNSYL